MVSASLRIVKRMREAHLQDAMQRFSSQVVFTAVRTKHSILFNLEFAAALLTDIFELFLLHTLHRQRHDGFCSVQPVFRLIEHD